MADAGGGPPPRKPRGKSLNTPTNLDDISLKDLGNPFAFYRVVKPESPRDLVNWLQTEGLLNVIKKCPTCGAEVSLNVRSASHDGCSYRCKGISRHEISVRFGSFLNRFRCPLPDTLNFQRDYCNGAPLTECCSNIGINYNSTGTRYGLLCREVMMNTIQEEYLEDDTDFMLPGPVEIGKFEYMYKFA